MRLVATITATTCEQGWKNHAFLKKSKESDFFDLNRIYFFIQIGFLKTFVEAGNTRGRP